MNSTAVKTAIYSVVLPVRGRKILLGIKKRKIFKDLWVGPGGGLEPSDLSIEHCAVREVWEEVRMRYRIKNLVKVAIIEFRHPDMTRIVHFFFAFGSPDSPKETDEIGTPKWFDPKEVPFGKMPPCYPLFLARVLAGEKLTGYMLYDSADKVIVKHELTSVKYL